MATRTVEDDEEALFRSLEDEDDEFNSQFREKRAHQLSDALGKIKEMREFKFGLLTEESEKEVIAQSARFKHCVVHFYRPEFRRCGIMNAHLQTLAQKYFSTKFFKINVDNASFLVEKLKVQVLPCVVCFVEGVSVDRVVGFEELGNVDTFPTRNLEKRLLKSGAIFGENRREPTTFDKPILGFPEGDSDDDFDD